MRLSSAILPVYNFNISDHRQQGHGEEIHKLQLPSKLSVLLLHTTTWEVSMCLALGEYMPIYLLMCILFLLMLLNMQRS